MFTQILVLEQVGKVNAAIGSAIMIAAAVTGSQEMMEEGRRLVIKAHLPFETETAEDQERKKKTLDKWLGSGPVVVKKQDNPWVKKRSKRFSNLMDGRSSRPGARTRTAKELEQWTPKS